MPEDMHHRTNHLFTWALAVSVVVVVVIAGGLVIPQLVYKTAKLRPATDRTCLGDIDPGCKPTDELKGALVKYNSRGVKVTNASQTDWNHCSYDINGLLSGYAIQDGAIKSGASVKLAYRQFTKTGGARLDSSMYKPSSFGISCDLSSGDFQASDFTLGD